MSDLIPKAAFVKLFLAANISYTQTYENLSGQNWAGMGIGHKEYK